MKVKIRERFDFDISPPCAAGASPRRFVVGERFVNVGHEKEFVKLYYVELGLNSGIRFSVLCRALNGELYLGVEHGPKMHSTVFRKMEYMEEQEVVKTLVRVANTVGKNRAVKMEEVPGFTGRLSAGGYQTHRDGWYTRSIFGVRLQAPFWAPEAEAYDIREGVYVCFPDGSFRLMRRKDYYDFCEALPDLRPAMEFRQGDCIPCEVEFDVDRPVATWVLATNITHEGAVLDRHEAVVRGGEVFLTHPEHGEVGPLPNSVRSIMLIPGSSRPFAQAHGD